MDRCALWLASFSLQTSLPPLPPLHSLLTQLMVTVPLDDYGPWEGDGHPPEADFIAKLKEIDGVSQVETQTITNMLI